LGRRDFTHGQFSENFTVEGLPDDEVCIGDRYRIGAALFEVTQPRVTCYRVGIRMDNPQMAALLTASGRPGFYFRVLEEGGVGPGDPIELVAKGPQGMTVAEVNALLYSPHHPRDRIERALKIPALSPGWRASFEKLARSEAAHPEATGNAGLVPAFAAQAAAPGFRQLRVGRIDVQAADVISLDLEPTDGGRLTIPLAGQYVVLRLRPKREGPLLYRSYSLSGPPSDERYRIGVKVEPDGAAGVYLQTRIQTGDVLDVSEPRGDFILEPGVGPVVLLSGGIGVTPVLAMLHALAASATPREVWWLHNARNGKSQVFAAEVRGLLGSLARGRSRIWYSRPSAEDRAGEDYDATGHLGVQGLEQMGVPHDGDFYICGPSGFFEDLSAGLAAWGVRSERVHSELFAGGRSLTPGVVAAPMGAPHPPEGPQGDGPLVSFARSGVAARWRSAEESLLELAEACDVPVRWSCRTGVCHNCESGLISGSVAYQPDPLDPPAEGNVLICCSRPKDDVVIDI
jgi:ferredoxin-NADP reductase